MNGARAFLANPLLAERLDGKTATPQSSPLPRINHHLLWESDYLPGCRAYDSSYSCPQPLIKQELKVERLRSRGEDSDLPTVSPTTTLGRQTESQMSSGAKWSHDAAMLRGRAQRRTTWAPGFLSHSLGLSLYSPKEAMISNMQMMPPLSLSRQAIGWLRSACVRDTLLIQKHQQTSQRRG